MRSGWIAVIFMVMLAAALGCSGGVPSGDAGSGTAPPIAGGMGPGISVAEALAFRGQGPLLVNGWLWRQGEGEVRLCTALSDSTPPSCQAPVLLVRGLDLARMEGLQREGDVLWSARQVQVLGELRGGVLVVSGLAQAN